MQPMKELKPKAVLKKCEEVGSITGAAKYFGVTSGAIIKSLRSEGLSFTRLGTIREEREQQIKNQPKDGQQPYLRGE